jgi:hypothetical protein
MTKHRAASGIVRRIFLGMAILVIASPAAMADPTTLICDTGLPLDMGPTIVDLNEAQSTVTLHLPALKNSTIPARVMGPFHAAFGSETITFADTSYGADNNYVINRLSATVALTQFGGEDHHMAGYANWTCHVGQKQF